jgi:hypothetical protein
MAHEPCSTPAAGEHIASESINVLKAGTWVMHLTSLSPLNLLNWDLDPSVSDSPSMGLLREVTT